MNKKWTTFLAVPLAAVALACGAGNADDTGEAVTGTTAATADKSAGDATKTLADGVYRFGQTVKFKDGSTLTVSKPQTFKRDKYAVGGEKSKVFVKFKSTFKNNTKEVFDPSLTTGSASAGGEEGDSIYQDGLDAPDNKVLPGRSVTWWMGYGVSTQKELQLEVNVGFLDYGTVIFTN
ncbi:hypothetical protein [Actinoplanes regularis]|uniref:hypothetical protein n=1 Tax=Actinoplanes regularis TaxID=52697 RepID=UPI0024A2A8BB|nr:hypothetical protein [Actinoplanes regularis]GLW28510.1 hypothetical protein Areg01_14500 [Actinoplanes regularis]